MKWFSGGPQCYIKVVDVKKVDGTYKEADAGKMVIMMGMECRGLVPTRWIPGMDFHCESTGGKVFPEVDLTELVLIHSSVMLLHDIMLI